MLSAPGPTWIRTDPPPSFLHPDREPVLAAADDDAVVVDALDREPVDLPALADERVVDHARLGARPGEDGLKAQLLGGPGRLRAVVRRRRPGRRPGRRRGR